MSILEDKNIQGTTKLPSFTSVCNNVQFCVLLILMFDPVRQLECVGAYELILEHVPMVKNT